MQKVLILGSRFEFFIIGLLINLEKINFLKNFSVYCGIGSNSIIALLLCLGLHPRKIATIAVASQIFSSLSLRPILQKIIEELVIEIPTLWELRMKYHRSLVVFTTNVTKGTTECFSWFTEPKMSCLDAVLCSAVQGYVNYGETKYCGNSILDSYPTEYFRDFFYIAPISENYIDDILELVRIRLIHDAIIRTPHECKFLIPSVRKVQNENISECVKNIYFGLSLEVNFKSGESNKIQYLI